MSIEPILDAAPHSDREQKQQLVERYRLASADNLQGAVIFGTARLGETILRQMTKLGIKVAAFADNDSGRWGSQIAGVPIVSPAEIQPHQPIVVASKFVKEIVAGLGARALPPIPHYVLPIIFPEHFDGIYHGLSAELIRASRSDIVEAYEMLEDESSRRLFATLLKFRLTLDPLDLPDPVADQYFPEFWPMSDSEVYVDVGACDGDTLRDFLARATGGFSRYFALEPDPENLRALIRDIPPNIADRVSVIPMAAGAARGVVSFVANLGGESRVGVGGEMTAEVAPLDEILSGHTVTSIKVDVEGYESEVLLGARGVIATDMPKIALSVYHKIPDLWTLPVWLKRERPGYRYFLRHHTPEVYDTVLYCLPGDEVLRTRGGA